MVIGMSRLQNKYSIFASLNKFVSQRMRYIAGGARGLLTVLFCAILYTSAGATPFGTTIPDGNNSQIPNTYPEVGGTVFVMEGANGNLYYQFVNPSTQFSGFQNNGFPAAFRGNPFQLGPTQALNCGPTACADYFGGSIAKMYVRLTARDGDTCPGNFDVNRITFRVNGFNVANFTGLPANSVERTNLTGTVSNGFENCFRNQSSVETSTGWFESTNAALLNNILLTGSTTPQIHDTTPNNNKWFFTDGNDATGSPEVAPGITIVKTADKTSYAVVGETINYTFEVHNIGSVTLNNVVVDDSFISGAVTCPQTVLVSDEAMTCSGSHTVTQSNIDDDIVFTNVASVSASPTEGTLGQVSGTITIPGPPADNKITISKTASKSANAEAGDVITYTYEAQNIGNITLDNVFITDDHHGTGTLSAITPASVTLTPNQSQIFTATYTVTQADVDSGVLMLNIATANATPKRGTINPPAVDYGVTMIAPAPAMDFTKIATPDTNLTVGSVVSYTYSVENTGNVSLTNVNVSDVHAGSGPLSAIAPASVASLAVGDMATFTASYTITQADFDANVDISNTATANVTPIRGTLAPETAAETVSLGAASPEITFAKLASDTSDVAAGDVITYTYTAENTGDIVINNVSVSDNHSGTGTLSAITPASVASLAVGQTATFTANYTVTQADIDAGGDITNTATITGTPPSGALPPTTAVETVDVANSAPALSVAKSATTASYAAVGDTVDYEYVVTNTGNVSVSAIAVTDDKIASVTCPAGDIAPMASVTCTGTYTVVQADLDAGSVTNNASATGTPTGGTITPAIDSETVNATQSPELSLDKTAIDTDFNAVGDTLDYEYLVTNTGNVEISALAVSDDKIASITCPVTVLAPTETTTCTGTYTVTQDDIDAGSVTNIASADGTPAGGTLSAAGDTETVGGSQTPGLSVNKQAVTTDFTAVGDQLDYTYEVTNTGNTTITDAISVDDDKITIPMIVNCPALPMGGLLPTQSLMCTATYMVTQADLDAGSVTNTATATDGTTTSAPDSVTVSGTQTPAMTLVKDAVETDFTAVGDTISYNYTVNNTGNVLIADLVVTDDLISNVICNVSGIGNGDANLDPAEEVVCTGIYTVTQEDLDAGSVTNNASAGGTPTGGTLTPPTTSETVDANQQPELTMAKAAIETSFDAIGDVVNYTYTVENTGNVFVSDIAVTDDKIAAVTCDVATIGNNDANLDVGETVVCIASYTITQADLDAGEVTNNASVTGTPAGGTLVDVPATATVNADQQPAMDVVKTATTVNFTLPGDVTSYEYVVTNTGNVTLTDPITVDDNLVSVTCPALPAGGLAPNAGLTCTSSYTVTQADLDNGSVTNLASATSGTTTSPQTSETIPGSQNPALSIVKSALFTDFTMAGEIVQYEYSVTNDGNLTLTGGVDIVDDKIGTFSCITGNFVPGTTQTCQAPYTITQADVDAGSVTNQAFAQNGMLVSPPQDVTVNGSQTPSLSFVKRATSATFTNVGDVVAYEFDVENTGNVTMNGVSVSDDLISNVVCPQTVLAPAGTMTCSASYTVTQADVDAGSVTNNASVTGTPPGGTPVNTPSSVTVGSTPDPEMTFAKRAVDTSFAAEGDVLDFEFDVANTGSVTLDNIVITDSLIAAVNCPLTVLAPAQTMVCSASYTVTQADVDAGSVTNNASVASDLPNGDPLPPVPSTATVDGSFDPSLSIDKIALASDFTAVGDVLDYTYTVRNTGNVTVTAIVVTDDLIPALTCPSTSLAPATEFICTGSYTVTQTDIDAGSVTNNAAANGTPAGGTLPTATDSATVTGTQSPSLEAVKTALTTDFNTVGDVVNYEYAVTNTGNITITDAISVSDDKIASVSCPALPSGGLLPTQSITCSAAYIVTQADIDAGSVTNTASATDGTLTSPNVSETVGAVQTPSLAMTKAANPQTYAAVNDIISYDYIVTNTGNVTVTDALSITDDRISVTCPALPAGGLAPNAALTCTGTDTITQADIDAGSVTNTASVSDGTTTSPSVSETVTADQSPALSIAKNALTADFAAVNDRVDYEYIVTNTGNVTITDPITVSDDKIAAVTCPVLPGGGLAPSATHTCTASYFVTQADIDAGFVTNAASATDGTATSPNVSETVNAVQAPSLSVTKTAQTASFATPGDVLTYNYLVRNTGNVTMQGNVTVADDRISSVSCPSLPMAGLAPNAAITCTANYNVTQVDIDAGSVTNIASATNGTTTSPTDQATVSAAQAPELTTIKTAQQSTFQAPNEVLSYVYEVINTGNTTITDPITVTDDKIATVNCPVLPAGGLAPQASITCSATYMVTQADIDAGVVANIASATDGTTTSADVTERVLATRIDGLEVSKTATNINFTLPGDLVTYDYVVTNTGNITIIDPISVNDNLITNVNCPALPAGGLAPNATLTCTAVYVVTQDNLDVGSVTNVASATDGTTTSSLTSETIPANTNPALDVQKSSADANFNTVGQILTYDFRLENTGNVTLTGATSIDDNKIGTFVCFTGNFIPAQVHTCQATYTVTQADIDNGSVTNDAFAMHPRASSPPDFVTIPAVQSPALTTVKTALTTSFENVGDTLSYEYVVTNSGNTTITFPVSVSDDRIANVNCPALTNGILAPLDSITCTATDTITQADIDAGSVTNVATASDGFTTSPPVNEIVNGIQTPAMDVNKVANDNDFAVVGDVLNYTYVVTNTGNVTLTAPISVNDNRIANVACPALPVGGLIPGAQLSCTGSDTVSQTDLDAGLVTNTASATDGTTTSPNVEVTVDGTQTPELSITKTPGQAAFSAVNDVLTYTYEVTNIGNVTITNAVTVSDDKIAAVTCPALPAGGLLPQAVHTCTASYSVTQADIDAGSVTNIASASDGNVTSPNVSANVGATQAPAMSVAKTATTADFAAVGDTVDYEYVVTNTGNVTITNTVTITDDRIAAITCPALPAGGLLPNAALTCTATDTIDQADLDAGSITNTAAASDGTTSSPPVSETVVGNQTSDMTISKVAISNDFAVVGDTLSYEYVVTNTGNVTITNPISVSDDRIAAVACPALPAGGLLPNATHTCAADYTVTQADIDAGSVTNIAFAEEGGNRSAPDQATITGTQTPVLTIVKSTTAQSFASVGEIVSYNYVVTNSGNVTVTNAISVADDKIASVTCPALPAGGLAPAQTLTCAGDYAITQADLDAGSVTNIASATDGTTISEPMSVSVNADQQDGLSIDKAAITQGFNAVGDVLSYEYLVTNTGNTTLTDPISVADDKIASVICPALLQAGIAPQASLTCAANYTVTQEDIDAGSVTNIASASAGELTSPNDEVTIDAMRMPELAVTKVVASSTQAFGPLFDVNYELTMTNNGNVTLTDLQLEDDLATLLAPATIAQTPNVVITGFTGGSANTSYDGAGDINLLAGSPLLSVGETGTISINVRIDTSNGGPVQGNTAYGSSNVLTGRVPSNDPNVTPNDNVDINPTPLSIIDTDGDGSPDNLESSTEDRDGDGIPDSQDYDPTGYFYCEENGDILSGGGISIAGPAGVNTAIGNLNNITIVQDGSQGYFQFYVTAPGQYTLTPTYPASGAASTDRPVQNVSLDVTSLLPSNPGVLGSSETGSTGRLADHSEAVNSPYYFSFDFEAGDPSVLMNNIPLKNCGTPEVSLNKSVVGQTIVQPDGRQLVKFAVTAENTGETIIEDVQMIDDLEAVFGAGRVEVSNVELTDAPVNFASTVNAGFNGTTNLELLSGTGDLLRGEIVTVEIEAIVNPDGAGDFINTAEVSALAPLDGATLTGNGSATIALLAQSDASLLKVVKTAQPRTVQIGDPVLYTVTVTNESASTMTDLRITDRIPHGFSYVPNTAVLENAATSLAVEPDVLGRGVLTWTLDNAQVAPFNVLQNGESMRVTLRLLAGPNVEFGAHENQAYVESLRTGTRSETATAVVDYIPEPTFDCTPVIGRVYDDVNHNGYPDDGEPGLPGVRLATVNGDIITTDEFGRYHIPCAIIADSEKGSNFLLKTDVRSLPLGYKPTTENPRVVRATRGKFVKMNFGSAFRPKLRIDVFARDFNGNGLNAAATSRVRQLLSESKSAERAIIVYHADDSESVDTAQAALQTVLGLVKSKSLKDIALEASWGDADVYDPEGREPAGQLFGTPKAEGASDYSRVSFSQNGSDIVRENTDMNGRGVLDGDAGMRGDRDEDGDVRDSASRSGVTGRRANGSDQTDRPSRLRRWIGWGNQSSAYADGLEIETTVSALNVTKRLNAQANVVAAANGRMIRAEGYWNYGAFIEKSELRLLDANKSTRSKPLAIASFEGSNAALAVTENMPKDMMYVLRVYSADGSFDETAPKSLVLGDAEFDLSASDWMNTAASAFGEDTLLVSNIRVRGGTVRVYGRNVPGQNVIVMGQSVRVDEDGKFVTEQLMPAGQQNVEVTIDGINDTTKRVVRSVDVKSKDTFFVGQIEATIGERVTANADGENSYTEGRVAFYVRSRLSEFWSLTATADTGEAEIKDLLSGLDDKDVGQLLRRLDPDRYYPTYGDDSTIEQDAPTSGRFYARLEHLDDYTLWGNYRTNFADTEFARVNRTLYGAKLHWDQNGNPTKFGDDRTSFTAFLAEGGTREARDELRGTGGSVYYLRHGDISIGGEQVRIETRDSVSGLVIETRRLTYGSDYDMDFIQGRILLNQPLGSTGSDGRLFRDGSLSGNEQILVIDYEYSPILGADDDALVYGARGVRWFGDVAKLGVTYNHDTDGGAESDLYEADLTLQYAAGTYIKGEIAQSKGRGVETYRSNDGGFSYDARPFGGLANNDTAMAYALEAAVDFAEIGDFNLDGAIHAYWRQRDAGFAGYSENTNVGITQYGGSLNLQISDDLEFTARADVSDDKTVGTNSYAEARVDYSVGEEIVITGGVAYNNDARGNAGTSVGAKAEYNFTEDNKLYVFGQVGVEGDNTRTTDRLGVGAVVRLNKNVLAGGEVSGGEDGLGASASVRYQYNDGDEYYLAYELPLQSRVGANYGSMNIGARRRYTDALSIYGEERLQLAQGGINGVTHAYGVDYKPGNWNLTASGEVGRVADLDRVALSAGAGFSDERFKAGIQGEYREDESVSTGDVRTTWLLRTTALYHASDELRLQGKFNLAFSDQSSSVFIANDFNQAEFTEGSLSAAYRPIWDDKFNLLAKYVYLEDLSPSAQRFNGETLNYRQRSEIISVDGSYDIHSRWTLGAKYGRRTGEVTSSRESLDFTKSMADLGVLRLDFHATRKWDALVEGRYLTIGDGVITRTGGLAGVYRHVNDNFKIGGGIVWGGIEEEYLAVQEDDSLGWYLNLIGKF